MASRTAPKVGEQLLVNVDPRLNNGHDIAPATVLSVNKSEGDDGKETETVNVLVQLDTGETRRKSGLTVESSQPKVKEGEEPEFETVAFRSARD